MLARNRLKLQPFPQVLLRSGQSIVGLLQALPSDIQFCSQVFCFEQKLRPGFTASVHSYPGTDFLN
jgi:hypothetical protein